MSKPDTKNAAYRLAQNWTTALAGVLEQQLGERPDIVCKPVRARELAEAREHPSNLWWQAPLGAPAGLSIWIGGAEGLWHSLLAYPGTEPDLETRGERARTACRELLDASLRTLAPEGAQFQLSPRGPKGGDACALGIHFAALTLEPVWFVAGSHLENLAIAVEGETMQETESCLSPNDHQEAEPGHGDALNLVLDLELPVRVTLGRVFLPLKDILKLTRGSVIDLNRSANALVEVLVSNRLFAKGEVVAVDGCYGVRVCEVAEPAGAMLRKSVSQSRPAQSQL